MARPDEAWMPMYWGDYLKKTARFTLAHHGAYMLLIAEYWSTGQAIPADPEEQALIVRVPVRDWLRLRPKIAEKFDERDDRWHHQRIDRELAKAAAKHLSKAKAGANGAAKRWQNDSTAMAVPSVRHRQIDAPSQSPSPSEKENLKISAEADFDIFWQAYPLRVAKGAARRAYRTALGKASAEAILAGAKRYAVAQGGKEAKFVKHPATWLNAECWADAAPAPKIVAPSGPRQPSMFRDWSPDQIEHFKKTGETPGKSEDAA